MHACAYLIRISISVYVYICIYIYIFIYLLIFICLCIYDDDEDDDNQVGFLMVLLTWGRAAAFKRFRGAESLRLKERIHWRGLWKMQATRHEASSRARGPSEGESQLS